MLVTIKYFGMLVEITNTSQESFLADITHNNVNELEQLIVAKYPKLSDASYNIAINQKITDKDHILKDGDELAFLPPFAGG